MITVPDSPGLGIELNRDILQKYRVGESLLGHERRISTLLKIPMRASAGIKAPTLGNLRLARSQIARLIVRSGRKGPACP